jgi:hypothetical protein
MEERCCGNLAGIQRPSSTAPLCGAVELRHVLPHPADVVAALRTATVGWLALAAIAEAQSTGRRGHRRLLPKECDA